MKITFTLIILCFSISLMAQKAGTLDSSFGVDGVTITTLQNGSLNCQDAATQKDGKIICAGSGGHDSVGGFAVLRYTADGMLDSLFGSGGINYVNFGIDYQQCNAVCLQPDDKIILTGYGIANIFNPTYFILTCRLNADGSLDSSFGNGGKIITDEGEIAYDVALQADGKIVVTGNSNTGIITLRYLKDGAPDKSFGDNGAVKSLSVSSEARTNLILPDNKILVGADNFNQLIFLRYNEDGSADKSFGNNGILYSNVYKHNEGIFDMILQPDAKVLVAAEASLFISDSCMLVRYMPDGSLDSSFGTNGVVINKIQYSSTPARVKLQQDGKIVMAAGTGGGTETYPHFLIARYNSNGSIDSSFSDTGYQITEISKSDAAKGLIIQQNGKIVLAGSMSNADDVNGVALARYDGSTKKQIIVQKIKHYIQTHNAQATTLDNVSVYPNPAQSILHIQGLSSNAKLIVVDFSGSIAMSRELRAVSGVYDLNIASLHAGNYLLKIETNGEVVIKQFVKE